MLNICISNECSSLWMMQQQAYSTHYTSTSIFPTFLRCITYHHMSIVNGLHVYFHPILLNAIMSYKDALVCQLWVPFINYPLNVLPLFCVQSVHCLELRCAYDFSMVRLKFQLSLFVAQAPSNANNSAIWPQWRVKNEQFK
jgi:hypothetical protein